jgi:hypothetical protein
MSRWRIMRNSVALCITILVWMVHSEGLFIPLSVDFTKILNRDRGHDTVTGKIHSFENRMVISVTHPINQYMFIDSLSTFIYNIEERSAIQLQRKSRSFLPFFQTYVGFFGDGQAIPVMFFKIDKSRKSGDSLVMTWVPKDKKTGFNGRIETVHWKDRPLSTCSIDKKGRILTRMEFSNDSLLNGRHVPFRMLTYTISGTDTLREEVLFRNLHIGMPPPDSIKIMRIPSDVSVKVLQW